MRILIVDDDPQVRRAMERVLVEAGHAVELAFDGHAAIRHCALSLPDLVLLDLNLGDGPSGFDVARMLPRALPIIIISGMSGAEIHEQASRVSHALAGALLVLEKPIDVHRLLAALEHIEAGRAKTDPVPPPALDIEDGDLLAVDPDDTTPPEGQR